MRTDPTKLAHAWESAQILQIIQGQIGTIGSELRFLNATDVELLLASFEVGERYFLGLEHDSGQAFFAWQTTLIDESEVEAIKFDGFKSLREVGGDLSEVNLTLAMHAIGLSNWHKSHPRCSLCGAETVSDLGGSLRICAVDSSQHYPRTDPAVIVLVKDAADRVLLGQQKIWPEKRFSTFAGFVEPGESFEECASREVFEETGLYCNDINYLESQAWPFPASIMIAFEAITDFPENAKADGEEIVQIRWFSRSQMKIAIENNDLLLPPIISVARKMITDWYCAEDGFKAEDLIGGQVWR